MKKLLLTTALIACCLNLLLSQPCLPLGIGFQTQEQIDNFQIDYPDCTEILGDVFIGTEWGSNITNLDGLSTLTIIGGDLSIFRNNSLPSLIGLNNLTNIQGNLILGFYYMGAYWGNNALTNLEGLDNLDSIGGSIYIDCNASLLSLSGLDNVTSIGGDLLIIGNDSLTSLIGLENLSSIPGNLSIGAGYTNSGNPSLISLTGLDNVTSIGGYLVIVNNATLTDLSGLDNLTFIGGSLEISGNDILSTCAVQSICDYLASPNGTISIYDNASGCNSQQEVEEACSSCLPEGIVFGTQEEIDSFQITYPGCTEIEGYVSIGTYPPSTDITNLNGLSVLTTIGGDLNIYSNHFLTSLTGLDNISSIEGNLQLNTNIELTSLTGLDNLTSITGNLLITGNDSLINLAELSNLSFLEGTLNIAGNASLVSLTGLENLTSVGYLYIGGTFIGDPYGNPSLSSLTGLNNLTSVGGSLEIQHNDNLSTLAGLENLEYCGGDFELVMNSNLTDISSLVNMDSVGGLLFISQNYSLVSLAGLENIDAATIENLSIGDNSLLATCEVKSICDYLTDPNGTITINDNAPGCNTQEEVEDACEEVDVADINPDTEFSIYPNPATKKIFIISKNGNTTREVNIYNQFGQRLIHENRSTNMIDVSSLKQGIYVIELVTNDIKVKEKLIIR